MREITGTLRGLLKKSNRPPQGRKNRVIFDETKNEFFEADYIILIREDCGYSEEDEEPCSCNNHEFVRICCEEGCQCSYTEDNKLPQSPKYTPPIGFVDEAALSPPDGYKDNGLKNSLVNALGGHVFGAQHIQQLQVIQRLQQQRAAMLAAKVATQNKDPPTPEKDAQNIVCTECAECAECSTQIAPSIELVANTIEGDPTQLTVSTVALLPLHHNSPERRMTQKEIIAGEERPKYIKEDPSFKENHDIIQEDETFTKGKNSNENSHTAEESIEIDKRDGLNSNKNGILKGGKLWKQEENQVEEITTVNANNTTGELEILCKRSVRFSSDNEEEAAADGKSNNELVANDSENILTELIPLKKHSSIFNNALRPNSAVRQLFPSVARPAPALTHEALRAFDESKRGRTIISDLLTGNVENDSIRKSERNTLRRSLLRKKIIKSDTSLEERIKLLTCDIDETSDETVSDKNETQNNFNENIKDEFKKKSIGEENIKPILEKNFSPASSASSSSSSSSQIYKKSIEKLNSDIKQDKNQGGVINPIVIIPQDCRCPAAPDLGIGVHVPVVHTQIHQTPLRQAEIKKQFLSTLAPLTSCVAGQKDDLSYYTLAANEKNFPIPSDETSSNDLENHKLLYIGDNFKVAPDVIAGTPGQERERDELQGCALQGNSSKSDKMKQKSLASVNSDDDEQNDYGFNKRPSVRGIKTKFDSSNKILQEMQDKINQTLEIENSFKFYKNQNQKIDVNDTKQCTKMISTNTQNQNEQNWNYNNENDKNQDEINQIPNYYGNSNLTIQPTFHSHQESSLVYQNCHSVTTEKHISRYARSPSRRPESPPPLRNYHQTMVLIPFNAETCSQLSTTSTAGEHHIQRQNILEYQQVTQQTIRVPIGYAFPTMQLHVLTGRKQVNQLAPYPRFINQRSIDVSNTTQNFDECRISEGATAVVNQCRNIISESSKTNEHNNNNNNNNNQAVTSATSDTVYYAMNV